MIRSGFLAIVFLTNLSLSAQLLAQVTAKPKSSDTPPAAAQPALRTNASTSATGAQAQRKDQPARPLQDIMAMLSVIDPYRPTSALGGKVRVYGSTAMDNMAHAWYDEFKQFHPEVTVEISAAGSGDAFAQLKQDPKSLVMLSRPVKPEELQQIKSETVKQPVAFVVAREALGVFVHATNPAKSISGEQLRAIFTKQTADADLKWKLLDVTGPLAEQPIHLVARSETSGTQSFLRDFVFGGMEMRTTPTSLGSNSEVLGALADDPLGITICGLRANAFSVRSLPLVSRGTVVPSDDTAVLGGNYPLTRSLTLVVDLSQTEPEALSAQELVHFALCRSGQLAAIRAGFFPAELPTLKAGLNLLQRDQLR